MDTETWLHGRLSSKSKCNAHRADSLAGGSYRMPPSRFSSDPEGSHVGSTDHPSLPASAALRSYLPKNKSSILSLIRILLVVMIAIVEKSTAASVHFKNCMSPDIVNSDPIQLQFIPLYVNATFATFNSTAASHNLNFTIYGNVTGRTSEKSLPLPGDAHWKNTNETEGKIPDVSQSDNIYTTLRATFNVLDYTPYNGPLTRFCESVVQGQCPLAPSFTNVSDLAKLPAFSVAHDLYSSYAFTTITAILKVTSGDADAAPLACVEASVTPDLGGTIQDVLTYIPLVILILVAIATACAAIFSPWGSADIFRWTSNYGRDADLLRLVTPGFGDCLQYIQFIILAGSLSLEYPGFYQPVVSQVSWSALMFNESFVSHGKGTQSLVDGVYVVANGTYGLDRMSHLVGMTADKDIWAGMVVWLLVILAAFIVLIQGGFVCRWGYRHISKTQEEDLRAKNIPFTVGNSIRIVFNYFLLPIVSLSTYQMVVAGHSPSATVGLAAVLLFACAGFAARLLWLVASTRPRSYLFDDLPTVLLYGPLYNTYSDNAATFALVPMMLTFIRGIAIGAVQPSGIAQLVLLAICEVILILTLNAFRPFHSPTSMNAFHTFFAAVRLLTILLSVAFVPSLGVKAGPRGWIGYVILFMHAIVLVFGFFLNACQTLIEVIARLAGAGGEEGVGGGAARGGLVKVFGMRQLSRRNPRLRGQARHSMASDANILGHESDHKSFQLNGGRSRSMSGSSAILLNRAPGTDTRRSMGLDSVSAASAVGPGHNNAENWSAPYTPTTSGGASAFSYLPGGSQAAVQGASGVLNIKTVETADPWYRPPRARRPTNDALPPFTRNKGSWVSAEWANKRWSQHNAEKDGSPVPIESQAEPSSGSGRATPLAAHLGSPRDRSDSNADESRRSKTDYAIREVDFYYGVRGPALSTLPTRRLKTGPADPTGPVSSATGWFKGFFGGKTKEKGKGFEVVRSSKAPPMDRRASPRANIGDASVPYSDESPPERTRDLELSDDGDAIGGGTRHFPEEAGSSPPTSEDDDAGRSFSDEEYDSVNRASQLSQFPPSLPKIEAGGGIELPSRLASKASSRLNRDTSRRSETQTQLPRRYSKRRSLREDFNADNGLGLSKAGLPSNSSPQHPFNHKNPDNLSQATLQPSGITSNRLPFESRVSSSQDRPSTGIESATSSILPPSSSGNNTTNQATSALGSHAPDLRQDRPSSMGYVQQHRASEHIHAANPDEPPLIGSSAEVVDDSSRRNTLSDRSDRHT